MELIERLVNQNMQTSIEAAKEVQSGRKKPGVFTPPQNLLDAYANENPVPVVTFIINEILGDYVEDIQEAAKQTENRKILGVLNKYKQI